MRSNIWGIRQTFEIGVYCAQFFIIHLADRTPGHPIAIKRIAVGVNAVAQGGDEFLKLPALHHGDIATLEDALAAERAGADAVATTLYGYTTETANQRTVSWPLVQSILANLTIPVLVEGHIAHPDEARMALDLGAIAVVVGSAITRPETITVRFVQAIRGVPKQ